VPFGKKGFGRRVSTLTVALAMAAAGWLFVSTTPALADTGGYPCANATNCSSKFGADSWCINGNDISPYGYGYRNCTDYVAWKIQQVFGVTLPKTLGNANTWGPRLKQDDYRYDSSPEVGDIAAWNTGGGGLGHVAYVFAVNGGIASLDEYNVRNIGLFTSTRTTAANSAGAPSEYVHIGPAFATTDSTWTVVNKTMGLISVFAEGPNHTLDDYWTTAGQPWSGPLTIGGAGTTYNTSY
jgi:surface antigen